MDNKNLSLSAVGDVAVVRFVVKKILDQEVIEQLGRDLIELVEKKGQKKMVLDFSQVGFLSSAVLGKLMSLDKTIRQQNGGLALCGLKSELKEIFTMTNLDKILKIKQSVADAVAALQ